MAKLRLLATLLVISQRCLVPVRAFYRDNPDDTELLTQDEIQQFMADHPNATAWKTEKVSVLFPKPEGSTNVFHQSRRKLEGTNYTEIFNLEGLPLVDRRPPDTVGDVGITHYIQMVNDGGGSKVRILDKTTGETLSEFLLDRLFPDSGQPCGNGGGDPIVLYDQLADRWMLAEFSRTGNHMCVYVSQTVDATGAYYGYQFRTPFKPDYLKFGIWPDAYYVGTNEPTDVPFYALERSAMLQGNTANIIRKRLDATGRLSGFNFQLAVPVDADGPTPPPFGYGLFVRHIDQEVHGGPENATKDVLELYSLDVDFPISFGDLVLEQAIEIDDFDSELCGLTGFECVPQPNTDRLIDPLREPVMHRPQYRNFGTHESIVLNWVTDVSGNDHHGIRWMELRRVGMDNNWTVHQQNDYAPNPDHRFMGSIAMNGDGSIALGYSISSATTFPGIRVTGRLADDPLGVMTLLEQTVMAGGGSQTSSSRYGDYTALTVDPVDDFTFWYTNQYIPASGNWATRIVKFTLDVCADGEDCSGLAPTLPPSDMPSPVVNACPREDACGIWKYLQRWFRPRKFSVFKVGLLGLRCHEKCVLERKVDNREFWGYNCGKCPPRHQHDDGAIDGSRNETNPS